MPDSVVSENEVLRARLDELTRVELLPGERVDVVISCYELNHRHGTGPLVRRVLDDGRKIFAIRARSDWGYQEFGDWAVAISHAGLPREKGRESVARALEGFAVRQVLCVPYLPDEALTALAIHDERQAPVCTWIMDDQNIASNGIADELMRELLEKSALRLATHPELCRAYERKYGLQFFVLPAVVPARLISSAMTMKREREPLSVPCDRGSKKAPRKGALIGSFWEQAWFDRLCDALEQCGAEIDWYGNNRSRWVKYPEKDLARAGITAHGVVAEDRLASELRKYPFAIVPVGMISDEELYPGIVRLSLPGRILFSAAASNTPVIVVGSDKTCAARFVKHFGIGEVVPYEGRALREAMDRLAHAEIQAEMRARARRIAPVLSDAGIGLWLDESVRLRKPVDLRFEEFFKNYLPERWEGVP